MKITKITLILGVIAGAAITYWLREHRPIIVDYSMSRDRQSLVTLFNQDWYWLTTRPHDGRTNTDLWFVRLQPHELEPGPLFIKVLRVRSKTIGFVAYYLKHPLVLHEGVILFLQVAKEYRGHHYGKLLMETAINDLKNKGVWVIRLVTRTANTSAQKLYRSLDFVVTAQNGGFVYFEKQIAASHQEREAPSGAEQTEQYLPVPSGVTE